MKKHILSLAVALCILAAVMPILPVAVSAAPDVTVSDYTALKTAIGNGGTQVIGISADFDFDGPIVLPNNSNITLTAVGKNITLKKHSGWDSMSGDKYMIRSRTTKADLTIGESTSDAYTITFDGNEKAGRIIQADTDGDCTLTVNKGRFTNNKNTAIFAQKKAIVNLYNCEIDTISVGEGAAMFADAGATFNLYSGVNIHDNTVTYGGSVVQLQGTSAINISGGTYSNNTSSNIRLRSGAPKVNISGGTFDVSTTGTFIGADNGLSGAVIDLSGGTVTGRKSDYSIIGVSLYSGVTLNLLQGTEGKGITFKNFESWDGIVSIKNAGKVNVYGVTFDNCKSPALYTENAAAEINIKGNINAVGITDEFKAVRFNKGTLTFSENARIELPLVVSVEANVLAKITGEITTKGSVAVFTNQVAEGRAIFDSSEFVAGAADKFLVKDGNNYYGISSLGVATRTAKEPNFLSQTSSEITLSYNSGTVTVTSDAAIPSAILIAASYNINGKLVDVEAFEDIAVAAGVPLDKTLKSGFNTSNRMKIMLWESKSVITPLVEALPAN